MPTTFKIGTETDRKQLAPLRASEWRGFLTVEQFVARNQRLYDHSYGQRIKTYLLLGEDNQILSSMDALPVALAQPGKPASDGYLVASVFTPNEHRGQGFGTTLLNHFFELRSDSPGILYSDIGAKFYERWGFAETSVWVKTLPATSESVRSHTQAPLEKVVETIAAFRGSRKSNGLYLLPQLELFDWQVDRFRHVAQLANCSWSEEMAWQVKHGKEAHFIYALPNYVSGLLEGMWLEKQECAKCEEFLQAKAGERGLRGAFYWVEREIVGAEVECPMVKIPGETRSLFLNPQRCDWW